jgi:hypothetical protein
MEYAVYFKTRESGRGQTKPPWDSRPTVDNIWAAFTVAEWATQQRLDWSHRERVFEMLKKKDAEIKQRRTANEALQAS